MWGKSAPRHRVILHHWELLLTLFFPPKLLKTRFPLWSIHHHKPYAASKKSSQVEQYCGLLSSLKSCYLLHILPSFTPVFPFYRLSRCLFMWPCLYIHYSYMKGACIWRQRFRVQSSLDNNCCRQLVSDLNELSVPSLSESLFRSALPKNRRFCSTILGNP